MIQRKQTVYLLLALILSIACMSLPIGSIEPKGMGVSAIVYNLMTRLGDGTISFSNFPLFVFLLLSSTLTLVTIFLYHNRKLQARLCILSTVLLLAWCVYLAFCWLNTFQTDGSMFHVHVVTCFPILSLILTSLARKGILDDERLVKAADRIR